MVHLVGFRHFSGFFVPMARLVHVRRVPILFWASDHLGTWNAVGHITIDMLPVEARSMQPHERSSRMSAAAAAAAAALAAQPEGDIEQGRRRAGTAAADSAGSRRPGLRGWVVGEQCPYHVSRTAGCLADQHNV